MSAQITFIDTFSGGLAMRSSFLLAVLVLGLGTGCSKVISLTVTNNLHSRANVTIDGPQRSSGDLGYVCAGGGRVTYDLVIPRRELPAVLDIKAGPYKFQYTVSDETSSPLWLELNRDGIDGPRAAQYPTYP